MSNEKTRILTMLSEGKVNVEEAEKLLKAIDENIDVENTSTKASSKKSPRFLRVQMDSSDGDKINVKVPIQVLRAGIRLSSVLPAEVNTTMGGIDLSKIGPENIDQFIESLADFSIDANSSDSNKLKIFCE